jgi:Fe-Mn family superoxide dismutase
MTILLPSLPFALDALEPHISAETLEYHYGRHHRGYVETLNALLRERGEGGETDLRALVRNAEGAVLQNAAQALNHTLYWRSLAPDAGGEPPEALARELESSFGSVDEFRIRFTQAACDHFGSGWAWLVEADDALAIDTTHDADCPLRRDREPLLVCDVWEHAYYLDHRNDRAAYLQSFWSVVDWGAVAARLFHPHVPLTG